MLRPAFAALAVILISSSRGDPSRPERCSSCDHAQSGALAFPNNIAERLQALPGSEVHSESSFEGCSTEKGCAGIKVKDGKIVEKYGDVEAFKAASNADSANEFTFHAGLNGNEVLDAAIPKDGPFWWMKENSPFRDAFGNFQKTSYSKSSVSSSSGGNAGGFSGTLDLSGNPFLNGDVSKIAAGAFNGAQQFGQSVDISQNPFLNGKVIPSKGSSSFSSSQFSSSSKFGNSGGYQPQKFTGYQGSSPSPFTVATSSLNQIENGQKASEFEFDQQVQQNIDEGFSHSGKIEHNAGELTQTCAGQGYTCVHKAQCNNGVVNTNGVNVLSAHTKKQYCNTKTEICCRIEIANIPGSGVDLQGNLGVGQATFGSTGSGQSIFGSNSGSSFQSESSASEGSFQAGGGSFGANSGSSGSNFGASASESSFGASGSNFGSNSASGSNFGANSASGSNFGANSASGSNFGANGASGSNFGATSGSGSKFGASASGSNFGATSSGSNFGATNSGSGSKFGSSGSESNFGATSSGSNFGATSSGSNFGAGSGSGSKFGASGSGSNFGTTGSNGNKGNNFGSTSTFTSSSSSFNSNTNQGQGNFGTSDSQGQNNFGASGTQGQTNFGASGTQGQTNFGASGTQGQTNFGATGTQGQNNFGASGTKGQGNFGSSGNQGGFTSTSSQSSFSSTNQGNFGSTGGPGNSGSPSNPGNFGSSAGQGTFGSTTSQGTFSSTGNQGFGSTANQGNFGSTATQGNFGSTANQGNLGSGTASGGSYNFKETSSTVNKFNSPAPTTGGGYAFTQTSNNQNNFIETSKTETDSFSSGTNIYNSGSSKPGVPYLPPVDSSSGGSNTSPGFLPPPAVRPQNPSGGAPTYLPPDVNHQARPSDNRPSFLPGPTPAPEDTEGSLLLDQNRQPAPRPRQPIQPAPIDIPSGCAAALKCTPIEFCTAEGVISNASVVLTKDQQDFRVPLTDCKDSNGQIGKCCRDSTYTDPWPTNQLGKWVPGVFGGDDGAYKPDNRGKPDSRPQSNNPVPARIRPTPPTTGDLLLNEYRTTAKPTSFPYPSPAPTQGSLLLSPNRPGVKGQPQKPISQGFGQSVSQSEGQFVQQGFGQYEKGGQGQFGIGSQGQFGSASQGQFESGSQGQFGKGQVVSQGAGTAISQGQGTYVSQGQGTTITQGQGAFGSQGQGAFGSQGQGAFGSQGQGAFGSQGQGVAVSQGQGTFASQGQGAFVSQGQGVAISQGQGAFGSQGQGAFGSQGQGAFGSQENSFSESRVFLNQYNAGGQCGITKGQKPYGNRNDLEVDFAEIPWQAMILLQTNRSLLCGGVITRPDVVITSASCLEGIKANEVMIKGGEWKLGIDEEPLPFQIVQVKRILRHPGYRPGSLYNDAAILVLAESLRLANNIYPICLPNAADTLDAFYNGAGECIVTGWGKQVLQVNIPGAIMHSLNISLINPGECQSILSQDYPHLLEQYDEQSCACGQPTNPINNVCKVDTGSALACTTGDGHFVLRGIYSWDSGCQAGNQLAAFYKFDLEWYQWAIGLIESARYAQTSSRISQQIGSQGQYNSGVKGGFASGQINSGVKGSGSFSKFSSSSQSSFSENQGNFGFNSQNPPVKYQQTPGAGAFSSSFSTSEKKYYQSKPQFVSYTTKPEIVTFTTKPEYFTYTTKPKIVTYTTQPKIVTYETSGTGLNPQYVAPGVTYNPGYGDLVKAHAQTHGAQCQCLENGK